MTNVVSFNKKKEEKEQKMLKDMGFDPALFPKPIIDMEMEEFVKLPVQEQFNQIITLLAKENQELQAGFLTTNPLAACYAPTEALRGMYNWTLYRDGAPNSSLLTFATEFEWEAFFHCSANRTDSSAAFVFNIMFIHDHQDTRLWPESLHALAKELNLDSSLVDTLTWFRFPEGTIEFE